MLRKQANVLYAGKKDTEAALSIIPAEYFITGMHEKVKMNNKGNAFN